MKDRLIQAEALVASFLPEVRGDFTISTVESHVVRAAAVAALGLKKDDVAVAIEDEDLLDWHGTYTCWETELAGRLANSAVKRRREDILRLREKLSAPREEEKVQATEDVVAKK